MARYRVEVELRQGEFPWSAQTAVIVSGPVWLRWLSPTSGNQHNDALAVLARRAGTLYPKHQFTFAVRA